MQDPRIPAQRKQFLELDKWRKKFVTLLQRDNHFSFDSVEGSKIFEKKGHMTTLEPKALTALGKEVLRENGKFWVLFTHFNK